MSIRQAGLPGALVFEKPDDLREVGHGTGLGEESGKLVDHLLGRRRRIVGTAAERVEVEALREDVFRHGVGDHAIEPELAGPTNRLADESGLRLGLTGRPGSIAVIALVDEKIGPAPPPSHAPLLERRHLFGRRAERRLPAGLVVTGQRERSVVVVHGEFDADIRAEHAGLGDERVGDGGFLLPELHREWRRIVIPRRDAPGVDVDVGLGSFLADHPDDLFHHRVELGGSRRVVAARVARADGEAIRGLQLPHHACDAGQPLLHRQMIPRIERSGAIALRLALLPLNHVGGQQDVRLESRVLHPPDILGHVGVVAIEAARPQRPPQVPPLVGVVAACFEERDRVGRHARIAVVDAHRRDWIGIRRGRYWPQHEQDRHNQRNQSKHGETVPRRG
ncbi:MAG: hypothetical protein NTY17_03300 [Planctomycetia bacterium]|nr:hypothetical protein [Planctomycetia bacterium]